jgi:hypothetical protein
MKNFLNDEQIEKLQAKDWIVVQDGAYINLYPEDFDILDGKQLDVQ